MSVTLITSLGTFKGRKIESCVRTNFGEKCRYAENPDAEHAGEILDQNDDIVAYVTKITERQPYIAPPSRSSRWFGAVSDMQEAIGVAEEIKDEFESQDEEDENADPFDAEAAQQTLDEATARFSDAVGELDSLKDEYQEWYDNLPENLQSDSPVADKLQEIIYMDFSAVEFILEDLDSNISDAENTVSDAEGADLPLGFGRD